MSRARLKPLDDQVVLITGASSGIGLATARLAARRGARVFLVARGEEALAGAAEAIRAAGGQADHAAADVGDRDALERAFDACLARFGRLDTVVGDAGVAIYSDLLTTPREAHERLFRTNYWGAVNTAELAVPRLHASGGGALVVVGSVASVMPSPVMGAYVATKHAVKGYLDSLRIELNRDKVPVSLTLVKPSGIATPLDDHADVEMEGAARIPPPLYAPEVVAAAILRAAVRPFREITVGGVGEAQVMFATHFPNLFSKLAGGITPALTDRGKAAPTDNLDAPADGGDVHSRREGSGRPFSTYTAATTHPGLALAATLAVGLAAAAAIGAARRRARPSPASWLARRSHDVKSLGRRLHR